MSTNDDQRQARGTDAGPRAHIWSELQRREGRAFLDWLDRKQRLRYGFNALATALRETLCEHVGTPSEARDVWNAAPAVLKNCNDPAT